jgi:uncharacterized protein YfdQ (DUF2303 family)
MEDTNRTEADAIIEAVEKFYVPEGYAFEVQDDKIPLLFLPDGMRRVTIPEQEVDEVRGCPRRRKGTIRALSLEALIELVNRHKSTRTIVYVDPDGFTFVGVLNDFAPGAEGEPGFRDHRVVYQAVLSKEWAAWTFGDSKPMRQGEFAAFLEEHVLDLLDPSGLGPATQKVIDALGVTVASPAVLRGLARDLSVRVKQQVREARNLATGETQVVFASEHATDDGRPLVVPGAFVVGIPVFEHGALYALVARLRYRVAEGVITWSYALTHPENAKRDAIDGMIATIREKTGVLVLEGAP